MPANWRTDDAAPRTGPRGGRHYRYKLDSPGHVQRRHKALCDVMIANPGATYTQLAAAVGLSPVSVANIVHNHAFQAYLTAREALIIDPALRASFRENVESVLGIAAEIVHRKLVERPTFKDALAVIDKLGRVRGMMSREMAPSVTAVQINFEGELTAARERALSVQPSPALEAPNGRERHEGTKEGEDAQFRYRSSGTGEEGDREPREATRQRDRQVLDAQVQN